MRPPPAPLSVDIELVQGAFQLSARFVAADGITVLFGPSGSGKTSLIHAVAGLKRPRSGRISLGSRVLFDADQGIDLAPHLRRTAIVFQDAQLFPHMSVEQNLRFGRWFSAPRSAPGGELSFDAVVKTLGIAGLMARRPASLSGGEKQRVGLARALLASPDLLVMDEPLASLDRDRRSEILPLIEQVRDVCATPVLYVTHAIEEVARLAADVVLLDGGRVVAQGPPSEVFATAAGAGASPTGGVSILEGIAGPYDDAYAVTPVQHPAGTIILTGRAGQPGAAVRVVVEAADVALALERPAALSVRTVLSGAIRHIAADAGPVAAVEVMLTGGSVLRARLTRLAIDALELTPGRAVFALVKAAALAGSHAGRNQAGRQT